MRTALVLMAALLLASCGSGNAPANNARAHTHTHDHEGPSGHVMGQFKLGEGYFMQASHEGAAKAGGTLEFEIIMKKDDEPKPGVIINVYASTRDGEPLSDKATGVWQAEKKNYTCTLKLPDDLPKTAHITFEAKVDGKDFSRSVPITGHDHH